jgi:hypothetical protein
MSGTAQGDSERPDTGCSALKSASVIVVPGFWAGVNGKRVLTCLSQDVTGSAVASLPVECKAGGKPETVAGVVNEPRTRPARAVPASVSLALTTMSKEIDFTSDR